MAELHSLSEHSRDGYLLLKTHFPWHFYQSLALKALHLCGWFDHDDSSSSSYSPSSCQAPIPFLVPHKKNLSSSPYQPGFPHLFHLLFIPSCPSSSNLPLSPQSLSFLATTHFLRFAWASILGAFPLHRLSPSPSPFHLCVSHFSYASVRFSIAKLRTPFPLPA